MVTIQTLSWTTLTNYKCSVVCAHVPALSAVTLLISKADTSVDLTAWVDDIQQVMHNIFEATFVSIQEKILTC